MVQIGKDFLSEKKSVLLLSPFFYPEIISTGKYNTYIAKEIVRSGNLVSVIAFHPFYPDWKPKPSHEQLDGMEILRGGKHITYPDSLVLRRIKLELSFAAHTIRLLRKRRNLDIVVPIFPPSLLFFLVSFFLPRKSRTIGIVHDLLGVMASVATGPFQGIMLKFIRFFEKKSLCACDKLIFVSQSMAQRAIMDYHVKSERTAVCYPFLNLNMDHRTNDLESIFAPHYRHVVYSGAIGEKQNPFVLLRFFQYLVEKDPGICCHIFSRGPLMEKLKETNSGHQDRIFFHDLVPEKNLYELYLRSDVQVIPQKESTGDGAIPSKLPNILCAGTPVFSISDPESELAKIVESSGIGYAAYTWNLEKLAVDMVQFLKKASLNDHEKRQREVASFVDTNFTINGLLMQLGL